jgi:hypothetical protein
MDIKEFMECDSCRAKAGTPLLCVGCRHNRALIEDLKATIKDLTATVEQYKIANNNLRNKISSQYERINRLCNDTYDDVTPDRER